MARLPLSPKGEITKQAVQETTNGMIMSQRNNQNHKTYAIMPGIKMGILTPDDLEKIATICRKFDVPVTKVEPEKQPKP